jgi:hypothetical protein
MAKPSNTRIKLRKRGELMEMVVPCRHRLSREAKHQIALTLFVDFSAALLLALSIWIGININILSSQQEVNRGLMAGYGVGLLFVLPLALWVLGAAFKNSAEMCKQVFSSTVVSIDERHLALSSQFWNFDWGAIRRVKVKDIHRVLMTDYQYLEGVSKSKAPCYVVLELDQGTVNLFAAEHRLSKAEAKWLGKEISRWIGVQFGSDAD